MKKGHECGGGEGFHGILRPLSLESVRASAQPTTPLTRAGKKDSAQPIRGFVHILALEYSSVQKYWRRAMVG